MSDRLNFRPDIIVVPQIQKAMRSFFPLDICFARYQHFLGDDTDGSNGSCNLRVAPGRIYDVCTSHTTRLS